MEARQTAEEIESLGRRATAVECDVRSEASVRAALKSVLGEFGRLDVLVNNAAVFESASLEQISVEAWDRTFETAIEVRSSMSPSVVVSNTGRAEASIILSA